MNQYSLIFKEVIPNNLDKNIKLENIFFVKNVSGFTINSNVKK